MDCKIRGSKPKQIAMNPSCCNVCCSLGRLLSYRSESIDYLMKRHIKLKTSSKTISLHCAICNLALAC